MSTLVDPDAPTLPHLPIDPRIRQRLVAVRKAEGRRRLRVLACVGGLVLLVAGALGVLRSPLARVRHVRISGAGPLATLTILDAVGLDRKPLMVDVHPAGDARRIESLPLVATAKVSREWPSTVRVVVSLRRPVAVVLTAGGRAEVDRTGRILVIAPAAGSGLPVLRTTSSVGPAGTWLPGSPGVIPPPSAAETAASSLDAELLLATALSGLPAPIISSEAVTSADGLVATAGATAVIFGDTTDLPAKVIALATMQAHGALSGAARLDLRVPDRPAVTPASATARP